MNNLKIFFVNKFTLPYPTEIFFRGKNIFSFVRGESSGVITKKKNTFLLIHLQLILYYIKKARFKPILSRFYSSSIVILFYNK